MVRVSEPCTVVGDIHGQYYDLLTLLDKTTTAAATSSTEQSDGKHHHHHHQAPSIGVDGSNYLFLGDYVDRGMFGVEVVLLLLSIKVGYSYPLLTWAIVELSLESVSPERQS